MASKVDSSSSSSVSTSLLLLSLWHVFLFPLHHICWLVLSGAPCSLLYSHSYFVLCDYHITLRLLTNLIHVIFSLLVVYGSIFPFLHPTMHLLLSSLSNTLYSHPWTILTTKDGWTSEEAMWRIGRRGGSFWNTTNSTTLLIVKYPHNINKNTSREGRRKEVYVVVLIPLRNYKLAKNLELWMYWELRYLRETTKKMYVSFLASLYAYLFVFAYSLNHKLFSLAMSLNYYFRSIVSTLRPLDVHMSLKQVHALISFPNLSFSFISVLPSAFSAFIIHLLTPSEIWTHGSIR